MHKVVPYTVAVVHPSCHNNCVPECIGYNKVWFGKAPLYSLSESYACCVRTVHVIGGYCIGINNIV